MARFEKAKPETDTSEAGDEIRHDAGLRQQGRVANEQVRQQVLNQGADTGTHSSSHQGVNWGPAYRMLKPPHPTKAQIEARAYELYVEHGCCDGHDVEDWLVAEKELTP